ncbi:TIGR03086 family metal-binding protein [Rhodococcus sp. APC 3903]|uniref:TIGR03086 family metal-binding protein n=1 Tax=Rhodococcus sp. APC 3903 TaxID=3035193 RepID=UPI00211E4928|nr:MULTISPECIES: TIGR03086 family metal-binding protein [Rhodococcus]MDN3460588.1 TIGR03086 family metal-binding protein [Rhodococcus sp. APC 3903]
MTALLRNVRDDQHTLPTPCDEYDVKTLSSHLIGTVGRIIAIAELGSPDSVSPIAPEHDAETFARLAARAHQAWADDALLDKPVVAPWGESPGRVALWGYTNEALVHGWDLAVATGQPAEADPALVEPTAVMQHHILPPAIRVPGVPFSMVIEPRTEAGPTERLANWSGRSSTNWIRSIAANKHQR